MERSWCSSRSRRAPACRGEAPPRRSAGGSGPAWSGRRASSCCARGSTRSPRAASTSSKCSRVPASPGCSATSKTPSARAAEQCRNPGRDAAFGAWWTRPRAITILHSPMASRTEAVDLDRTRDVVHQAYTSTAARVLERGFRDNPTYIATKALVDWDLLEGIDLTGTSVLNVGCLEPIDEMHFARHVGRWTAVDVHPDVIGM